MDVVSRTRARTRGSRPVSGAVPHWLAVLLVTCVAFVVVGATIWLAARVLGRLMPVTAAVVAAVLLTALLQPMTDGLERLKVPRWLSALVTVIAGVGAVGGVGYLLVQRVMAQSQDLGAALRRGTQQLQELLHDSPLSVSGKQLEGFQQHALQALKSSLPTPATGAALATQIVTAVALGLFLWFFLLKDGSRFWRWFLSWVPSRHAPSFETAGSRAWGVLTSYVRGTVVIALADAIGIGAAMLALRVPLVVSLTLLVFLGAFVPIVGSTVSGALAVGVTFATLGPVQALLLLAAVVLVQQLEGNLLQPLVMGRALHLHPVTIVLAVTVGALLAGVLGALVAVPLAAIVYRVTEDLSPLPRTDDRSTVPDSPQAQDPGATTDG